MSEEGVPIKSPAKQTGIKIVGESPGGESSNIATKKKGVD